MDKEQLSMGKKYYTITYGCQMNESDTERINGQLEELGYRPAEEMEDADIVIMNDELTQVVTAMKIANKTHTIVYQNIFFALGVKAIFLVLGAFGLASMWEAVFADTGVALIAIANAMRVMRTNKL